MSTNCKWFLDNQSSFKPQPTKGDTMSTIKTISNYYLVTRPDGSTIKCHNLATAKWYVRNPEAK